MDAEIMDAVQRGRERNARWTKLKEALLRYIADPTNSRANRLKAQQVLDDSVSTAGPARMSWTGQPDNRPKGAIAARRVDKDYNG